MKIMDKINEVIVILDESITPLESKIFAPEKVEDAKNTIERMGLPNF